jgi:hypothetical protein
MLVRKLLAVISLSVLTLGCQGLTNGKMEWVQPTSDAPRAGNVYLVRGLIGVFSTGMDALSDKINAAGVRAKVFQDLQDGELANAIIAKYKGVKNPEPLILIGHSYGADDVLTVSHKLETAGIPINMVVTVDATIPPTVPTNVAVEYNYFQSQPTDFIPMFRGIPLKQEKPGVGQLTNMDLRKDRLDLLMPGTNHINIDKNTKLHDEVVQKVLAICPPRQQWLAQHSADARFASPMTKANP